MYDYGREDAMLEMWNDIIANDPGIDTFEDSRDTITRDDIGWDAETDELRCSGCGEWFIADDVDEIGEGVYCYDCQ